MVRDHLFHKTPSADNDFRWRGGEVSRIEAFADGIFAITITLLIVSGSATEGFYDMWLMIRDLPAFFLSFAMIMYAWLEHYIYFRRYGLADGFTLFLNAVFLFLVMTLAYPLKLLSTFLWYLIIGEPTSTLFTIPEHSSLMITSLEQRMFMMYFYGAATIGLFGTLLLMHINAFLKRNDIELDEIEIAVTKQSIAHHLASTLIALISISVLALSKNPGLSGVVYFLMPLVHPCISYLYIRKIKQIKS